MLNRAGWILIILGSLETLLLIYAVVSKSSFTGGSFLYILIGIFLLKKGVKSYKFSQFIFTAILLFIPASLIFNILQSIQLFTASDINVTSGAFTIYHIIFCVYILLVAYIVMLLHHPDTRTELSLQKYDSNISTLYIPKRRVIIFSILFIIFSGVIAGPHILTNSFKTIIAGLIENELVLDKVGEVESLNLISTNYSNWSAITFWKINGMNDNAEFIAILDPESNLEVHEFGANRNNHDGSPKNDLAKKKVYSFDFIGESHKSVLQLTAQSSVLRASIISYDDQQQTERYVNLAQSFLEKEIPVTSVYRTKKKNTSGAGVICNSAPLGKADTIEQLEILLYECAEQLKTAQYLGEVKLKNISVDW